MLAGPGRIVDGVVDGLQIGDKLLLGGTSLYFCGDQGQEKTTPEMYSSVLFLVPLFILHRNTFGDLVVGTLRHDPCYLVNDSAPNAHDPCPPEPCGKSAKVQCTRIP